MTDDLAAVEAQVEKVRQIDKLAGLLGKFPMPKPAQIMLATELYEGGARVDLPPIPEPTPTVAEPVVESPMRARLRSENPELVAKIEAAEDAKRNGDTTQYLNLITELRPQALAELQELQAKTAAVNPKDFA